MKQTPFLCFSLVPIVVLAAGLTACGNRQGTQSVAQQTAQPAPSGPPPVEGQPADAAPAPPTGASPRYDRAPRNSISLPTGTVFDVRLEETLDTKRNRAGDHFTATLNKPVVLDGRTLIPKGTPFAGHIIESQASGRLKGRALMSLSLDSFELNGRRHEIKTTHVGRQSGGHKKRNWVLIGGGSGVGSAIGAVAGGPAGALIGAGAGAGAGTAGAALTGKKSVRLPVETLLAFSLRDPVTLTN